MVIVASFSGGRTSGHLVRLLQEVKKSGKEVIYLFMDTGAEHPETYKFIKQLVKEWGIKLICLRVVINPEMGKGNSYREIDINDIGPDLQPWRDMVAKYGLPYVGGAFCTRVMKAEVFERYCKDNFDEWESWLGMRIDEQVRIWGKGVFQVLKKMRMEDAEMNSLYADLSKIKHLDGMVQHLESRYLLDTANANLIAHRVVAVKASRQRFMAEISDLEKQDIINWWAKQPFDLGIEEHLGNCVFCIKKDVKKVALALKDEPEMAVEFKRLINSPEVKKVDRDQQGDRIMYRQKNSLEDIESMFSEHSRTEIAERIKGNKEYQTNSCSESCEPFFVDLAQMDLFGEEVKAG